ncbi:transposase [Leptolyngbya boryana NIES-2135]|jgi:hypothetical protein|uniref:Transposase n=1 Tax=Leptolyngbya boryana NIES-2135 TaxID=1973484 RepID=A0A1Z4JF37_LEPBY|nr:MULTISPECIES: hypothetical protein [Leptolyngbya]BAY55356.1 transposase [Leptolyngbya boryana NIES-2135]MBD2368490.1 hypothetical protein [Leptolyngbya sp. FACHB-161]MBD2374854.1 hypothetical protein [Leptolyngbya sp. FACHB-238]MBD2399274.1 hypothetical protein [Leptolyngbya sp. FACHB-239]MBD2405479.1 hypothetical protein [Leptolyngbya sp. FACHB-402]
MSRTDLLALTTDDLTLLTNRGIVNRAKRELEQFTVEIIEKNDFVRLKWSDSVECTFPNGEPVSDRQCNCSANTICRHLIRSILAYQQSNSFTPQPWNPGSISDEELTNHFTPSQLQRLKQQFETDQVIEVRSSTKPIAYLHSLGHTLRFLVPHDLRYTHCDCSEPSPCQHVPLAIWAFRQLHDQTSAIISTETDLTTPTQLLDDIESVLETLLQRGLNNLTSSLLSKLQRCEQHCRQSNLIWFAEILVELLEQCDRYQNRDARFSPHEVIALIAELCIRSDALRSNTGKVPRLFIAGTQRDRTTAIGTARLIGLGCGVQLKQNSTTLTSYFQDANTGMLTAFSTESDAPDSFSDLAQKPVLKQHTFTELGSGQLLIQSAKRSPDFRLLPGRSPLSLNPQSFQWSQLRSPLLVEDFSELSAHLQLLPPADLRPRHLTENLYVLAIDKVTSVEFSSIEQAVTATLWDAQQNAIRLNFPYHDRAQAGTEALLTQLTQEPLRFVSGHIRSGHQLTISPIGLVFEDSFLQPWIAEHASESALIANSTPTELDPIETYLESVLNAIADLLLIGIEQSNSQTLQTWREINEISHKLGFQTLTATIDPITSQLTAPHQNLQSLSQSILTLSVLHHLVDRE